MPTNILTHLLKKTVPALAHVLKKFSASSIETSRIARIGTCLLITGGNQDNPIILQCKNLICDTQRIDGGWADTEETMWNLAFLKNIGYVGKQYFTKGLLWLNSQRHHDGGWGRTNRDISRIPITGLFLHLFPELSDQKAANWLKKEWRNDFQGDVRLTYKGGFFLLGLLASEISIDECPLIKETYFFLADEQNEDGGFGPWKDHPIGSDPWSTGIVLLGLLSYPELVKREIIEKTVNWLAENQLPNGLWPYHYIEEGSAYAYWGLVEALKYLSKASD